MLFLCDDFRQETKIVDIVRGVNARMCDPHVPETPNSDANTPDARMPSAVPRGSSSGGCGHSQMQSTMCINNRAEKAVLHIFLKSGKDIDAEFCAK
jgi:hypothetical protein